MGHAHNLKRYTYRATLPDGKVVTRTTTRNYTHIVAILYPTTNYDVERGSTFTGEFHWGMFGWCGRLDLAQKTAAKYQAFRARHRNGKIIYLQAKETRLIEVENPRGE